MIASEATTFTLDKMGWFSCNTSQEALDSPAQTIAGRRRDVDVIIIIGGGVPMLPADYKTLISIQPIQKKQPTTHHHHATHN